MCASAATDSTEWVGLFDGKSLGGWQVTNFGGQGSVSLEGEQVLLEIGNDLTGITWEREFPKVDYEIMLDAMRLEGNDFFCGLTVPVRDSFCSLIVGGWGGTVVGISSVDGRDAAENPTSKLRSFDSKRWYRIQLRVTRKNLKVWIDDTLIIEQPIEGHTLTTRPEVDLSKPLGIASWRTRSAIRAIHFRNLPPERP